MTSITSFSAASAAAAYRVAPATPVPERDTMAAVADTLGLSSNAVRSELSAGKSLQDVATAQGVTRTELVDAIKAGLPTGASEEAERIAARTGTPPPPTRGTPPPPTRGTPPPPTRGTPSPPAHGHNGGLADPAKLDGVSDLLNMPAEQVAGQAATAPDLIAMLQNRGVDLGRLRAVMSSGDLLDVRA
ncbi:hypothetical protein [Actinoplanes sp. NBRC 103695]|uniref:hypothetical protein n=1 Tax=Actinoplanes sp. NBRC 103695 TaxID=3032202 RepID=UPI0024A2A9F7|nr:hypothetical protein [Actinoplanes sp. NBRC 103695]GLY94418.1 hypothetical protein Acsp02_16740 [Actinoplanes sp. NBRC 103695]